MSYFKTAPTGQKLCSITSFDWKQKSIKKLDFCDNNEEIANKFRLRNSHFAGLSSSKSDARFYSRLVSFVHAVSFQIKFSLLNGINFGTILKSTRHLPPKVLCWKNPLMHNLSISSTASNEMDRLVCPINRARGTCLAHACSLLSDRTRLIEMFVFVIFKCS